MYTYGYNSVEATRRGKGGGEGGWERERRWNPGSIKLKPSAGKSKFIPTVGIQLRVWITFTCRAALLGDEFSDACRFIHERPRRVWMDRVVDCPPISGRNSTRTNNFHRLPASEIVTRLHPVYNWKNSREKLGEILAIVPVTALLLAKEELYGPPLRLNKYECKI